MSYILEALKKSQQERELGQVPRLQSLPFEDPPANRLPRGWAMAAVGLAGVAAALALYTALRVGPAGPVVATPEVAPQQPLPLPDVKIAQAPMGATDVDAANLDQASERSAEPRSASVGETEQADDNEHESAVQAEPQVLVVPAPPKPGQYLPRGAEELRRAVLGSDRVDRPRAPLPVRPTTRPEPEGVRVPDDLLADIEAFKQRHGAGASGAMPPRVKAPKADPEPVGERAPAALASAALRRRLPEFAMSVHVYDADPTRRFVYINGRKVRERQTSREGLRLEQVVADGAVLSWEGERFFEPR